MLYAITLNIAIFDWLKIEPSLPDANHGSSRNFIQKALNSVLYQGGAVNSEKSVRIQMETVRGLCAAFMAAPAL